MLGIDVGGSGIKGAPVDLDQGVLIRERHRIVTPQPATPEAVAGVIRQIADHFEWEGPIGCAFPAVIKGGRTMTAANVDSAWIGADAGRIISEATGSPVTLLNDADAAGLAEMAFGAGRDEDGVVFMLTIGTGIGSAIFHHRQLLPNTELGHLEIRGTEVELWASDRVRKEKALKWQEWAERFNDVLLRLEALFWPDLFILGGGASKKHTKYMHHFTTRARVVPARLLNYAGIVGAALSAKHFASQHGQERAENVPTET